MEFFHKKNCIIGGNIDVDIDMDGHWWLLVDVLWHYYNGMLAIDKKKYWWWYVIGVKKMLPARHRKIMQEKFELVTHKNLKKKA
jgi:hypothetical protein